MIQGQGIQVDIDLWNMQYVEIDLWNMQDVLININDMHKCLVSSWIK